MTKHAISQVQLLGEWLTSILSEHRQNTNWHGIGLVVGPAGSGKTTALKTCIKTTEGLAGSEILLLITQAEASLGAMLKDMLVAMGKQTFSRTIADLTGEVAAAIKQCGYTAIIIDQAEALPHGASDIWRELLDEAECLFVFVGRPSLAEKLCRDTELWSRVGCQLEFPPPVSDAVLGDILPGLQVQKFQFDPTVPEDRVLGEALWHLTQPSLRDFHQVLLEAAEVTRASNRERIGLQEIHWAFGRVVQDKPKGSWVHLMWVVAVTFLRDEYPEAHMIIEQGWVSVNGVPISDWYWIVQAGDVIYTQTSETKLNQITLQEQHIRQAYNLLQRIAREKKPWGREPYL